MDSITGVGEIMGRMTTAAQEVQASIEKSDEQGKGIAGRLVALRTLAKALEDPSTDLERVAATYAADLVRLDPGVLAMIRLADQDESARDGDEARQYFAAVREMADKAREASASFLGAGEAVLETARAPRDLRPPARRIAAALRSIADAQAVFDEWVRQIEQTEDRWRTSAE